MGSAEKAKGVGERVRCSMGSQATGANLASDQDEVYVAISPLACRPAWSRLDKFGNNISELVSHKSSA